MIKTSICIIITILFFVSMPYCAPPNPKLLFNQLKDGKFSPKMNIAEISSTYMFDPDIVRKNYIKQADGIEYILAIRIDFSDQPGVKPASVFNDAIFGKENTSMFLYFDEVSYGQMQILPGYLGGAIPDGDRWYRAKNKMSYYGTGNIMAERYRELAQEACSLADADIDFSKYDRDNDGFVDHLMIIHSGNDEASSGVSNDIWSAVVDGIQGVYDGKSIMSAIIVSEDPSEKNLNIGIFCHEFFHEFGAPDLYSWDYPAGYWCLMGMFGPYLDDGQHPSHISSYLKWDFDADRSNGIRGWLTPIELSEQGTYTVDCLALPQGSRSYKIDIPGKYGKEYFMIENRNKNSGKIYDTYLPESGIIIWHIDENQPKSFSNPHRAWVEDPSDPDRESPRHATSGAAFSANDKQTSFTPATYPNSNANDGTHSGVIISDIGYEGLSMTFSFFIGDSYEPNDNISSAFGPLEFGKQYISFIKNQKDIDCYMIRTEQNTIITIYLEDMSEDYNYVISILDSNGNSVSTNSKISQTAQKLSFKSSKSTNYYILVSSSNGNKLYKPYSLTVESSPINKAPENVNIVKAYPNPGPDSNGFITFEYKLLAPLDSMTFNLYTFTGTLVYSQTLDTINRNDSITINVNELDLANGIYIYSIKTQSGDNVNVKSGKIAILR